MFTVALDLFFGSVTTIRCHLCMLSLLTKAIHDLAYVSDKAFFKTSCYRICNVRNCKQVARQYSVSKSHLEVFLVTFGEVVKSQKKPFVCCARNKSVSQSTALSTISLFSFHKPLQFDSFDICLTNYRSARRMSGIMTTYACTFPFSLPLRAYA